ncbi:MAG: PKD domain-containing protein [Candidatus Kariarchaeaceae archaeon]|jgi:PKD repeat protein
MCSQLKFYRFPRKTHPYPAHGEYEVTIKVVDADGLEGELEQTLFINGPEVTLNSSTLLPIILEAGAATVDFYTDVEGGEGPYTYSWDLDNDGTPDAVDPASDTASHTYTEGGKYKARVTVTDGCGFSDTDKLTVVILDLEDLESEVICHPMANKIYEGLKELLPEQTLDDYSCEDIFNFFRGGYTDSQLGFGRMWQAYRMALTIDELSWEDILDWQLDTTGWGMLKQLDSFAEAMEGITIVDLVGLVINGENSIGDVRTAMRMSIRYDADIYEALTRIAGEGSAGEISQFYRLAQELEVTPEEMDALLALGASMSELRHAWKYAERTGTEFEGILEAHVAGNGWGAINQANRLADETTDVGAILEMGIQEYRKLLREQENELRLFDQDNRMALKLADHFGFEEADVMGYFESCEGNWGCVRKALREQEQFESEGSREQSTAARIAKQYDKTEPEVMAQYELCDSDWSCVRAFYRETSKGEHGKGSN